MLITITKEPMFSILRHINSQISTKDLKLVYAIYGI